MNLELAYLNLEVMKNLCYLGETSDHIMHSFFFWNAANANLYVQYCKKIVTCYLERRLFDCELIIHSSMMMHTEGSVTKVLKKNKMF